MVHDVPRVVVEVLDEMKLQLGALSFANIPDAWIGAGAIRNRVWNRLFGCIDDTIDADWDVAFSGNISEQEVERRLNQHLQGPWEAIDQRRFGHPTAVKGIASWPETATAMAARTLSNGTIAVVAPWGFDDLLAGRIRPTPTFFDMAIFNERQHKKSWNRRWPALRMAARSEGIACLSPYLL